MARPLPAPSAAQAEELWFANGTTALWAALVALGCKDRLIAVQPNVCPNVPAAILASGNRPLFLDIEHARFGIDPAALEAAPEQPGAIIAVHSFGIPCRIEEIAAFARRRAIPLIEDCAQAEGASVAGCPVGAFGDVAVFSYGAGKIVDAGGGGRAAVRTPGLAGRMSEALAGRTERADPSAATRLSQAYKAVYNESYPAPSARQRAQFTDTLRLLGTQLVCGPLADTRERCSALMRGLTRAVEARREKARLYRELLSPCRAVRVLPLPEGSVPWRFNIWFEGGLRDRMLRALLKEGVPVSSWYPRIDRFLAEGTYQAAPAPTAEWLDRGIMNLWLDEATTPADIQAMASRISAGVA